MKYRIFTIFFLFVNFVFSQHIQNFNVPVRDGIFLSTDVYFPSSFSGSLPVILMRTPYGKGNYNYLGIYFALKKYIFVIQDTRGHGKSQGQPSGFLKEGEDGYDTVLWIKNESWCNGKIGLFGGSAMGINNYLLISENPPSLLTAVNLIATPDLYEYAAYPGGVFREYDVIKWMEETGEGENIERILENPQKNWLWDLLSLDGKYENLKISTLNIGGWYDLFCDGTVEAYRGFKKISRDKENQVLIMGPWTHTGFGSTKQGELNYPSNSILDISKIIEEWFDYFLKEKGEKPFSGGSFYGYLMGDVTSPSENYNIWVNLKEYNTINYPLKKYYLSQNNKLTAQKPGEIDFLEVNFDPENPVPTIGGANLSLPRGPYNIKDLLYREDILYFKTEPLKEPLKVLGQVYGEIFLSTDVKDLDLCIRLADIYPDGRWMLICDGCQRARFRESFYTEKLLEEGKVYKIKVNMGNTFYYFKENHSIGIILSGSNYPRFEVNPQSGEEIHKETGKMPARVKIFLSKPYYSRIVFPTLEEGHTIPF